MALAVQANFFWNVVTSYLFPLATESLGASYTFGIFTIIDIYALYFVYMCVPETKGLSLEDIEILLGASVNPGLARMSETRPSLTDRDRDTAISGGISLHNPQLQDPLLKTEYGTGTNTNYQI